MLRYWVIHYIDEGPYKDRSRRMSARVCVCVLCVCWTFHHLSMLSESISVVCNLAARSCDLFPINWRTQRKSANGPFSSRDCEKLSTRSCCLHPVAQNFLPPTNNPRKYKAWITELLCPLKKMVKLWGVQMKQGDSAPWRLMLQTRSIFGEVPGTRSFGVRRAEFGCIMKAGDCTQKALKGSLFFTNQSISATGLIAQSCVHSEWTEMLWQRQQFLTEHVCCLAVTLPPLFYISAWSLSFVVVNKTICNFAFDLGKMDQSCLIYAERNVWMVGGFGIKEEPNLQKHSRTTCRICLENILYSLSGRFFTLRGQKMLCVFFI